MYKCDASTILAMQTLKSLLAYSHLHLLEMAFYKLVITYVQFKFQVSKRNLQGLLMVNILQSLGLYKMLIALMQLVQLVSFEFYKCFNLIVI